MRSVSEEIADMNRRVGMDELSTLRRQHAELEQKVADLEAHPSSDPLLIARLKRDKLRIKDRIAQLERPETPGAA